MDNKDTKWFLSDASAYVSHRGNGAFVFGYKERPGQTSHDAYRFTHQDCDEAIAALGRQCCYGIFKRDFFIVAERLGRAVVRL